MNSLYPSAEESWEEMTKTEPRNKMLYSPGSDQWPGRPVILVADLPRICRFFEEFRRLRVLHTCCWSAASQDDGHNLSDCNMFIRSLGTTLKTVTSLNKESRLFHFPFS